MIKPTRYEEDVNQRIKLAELSRLQFIYGKEGEEGARRFALQGLTVYYRALSTPYGKEYRRELINSIVVYRKFTRGNICLEHK